MMGVADVEAIALDGGVKTTRLHSVFLGGFEAASGVAETSGTLEVGGAEEIGAASIGSSLCVSREGFFSAGGVESEASGLRLRLWEGSLGRSTYGAEAAGGTEDSGGTEA